MLAISERRLDQLVAADEIPYVRLPGRRIVFRLESLNVWLKSHESGAKPDGPGRVVG
jgi:hypothetical protein